jgi:PKD repeat protein
VFVLVFVAVAGINEHVFTSPYFWNGSDNLLIEVCFDNDAWTQNSTVYTTTTSFQSSINGFADLITSSGCTEGAISGTDSDIRPNIQLDITQIPCSSVRTPVSFTVDSSMAMASFVWVEDLPTNPGTILFDASASVDADAYIWDFGDGSSGAGQFTSHAYAVGDSFMVTLVVVDSTCGTTDTVSAYILSTIGLEESLVSQTLSVYPNPTNGVFRTEFSLEGIQEVTLRVMNSLGQIVEERKVGKVTGSYETEFDLSKEPTGIYILQIRTDDGVVNRRITLH